MRILHISADYPDPLDNLKPSAIANLIALADGHEHRVVSINRVGRRLGIHAIDFADKCGPANRAVVYAGLPKTLMFRHYLNELAAWLIDDCRAAGFVPDLVQAHKLTVEGTVGIQVAEAFGAPLVLSIQGNTDVKVLKARRDLREHFRTIWHRAVVAFPFAVWARREIEATLGARAANTFMLPCPGPADATIQPKMSERPVIRTAFHFHGMPNKNADSLIRAVAAASRQIPDISLDIIGGGDAEQFAFMAQVAAREAPGRVRFLGPVNNAGVQRLFHEATAFAMVSFRESYGIVYAESLLAGTPCIYPRGQGIDGYFEDGSILLAIDPRDVDSITKGVIRMVKEEAAFKERLARVIADGGLKQLTREHIRQQYIDGLAIAGAARA
jgi:glycosyltransferase involved in cell wall biosynthesis